MTIYSNLFIWSVKQGRRNTFVSLLFLNWIKILDKMIKIIQKKRIIKMEFYTFYILKFWKTLKNLVYLSDKSSPFSVSLNNPIAGYSRLDSSKPWKSFFFIQMYLWPFPSVFPQLPDLQHCVLYYPPTKFAFAYPLVPFQYVNGL